MQRQGLPSFHEIQDEIERLSIETSHPTWLVKRWVEQLGVEEAKKCAKLI